MTYGDDLDRALFELPLEQPPADLRRSILNATIYAPPAPAPVFSLWETVGLGFVLAVACWLSAALLRNPAVSVMLIRGFEALGQALANPATLEWTATGAAVALVMLYSNAWSMRGPMRAGRS